ncbi:MAG: arsenite methyltransferase [Bacteroidales bacterium]
MKPEDLKLIVQDKYASIARQGKDQKKTSCCCSKESNDDMDYSVFSDDYTSLEGYNADADLSLGCGLPTQYAGINKGDHVLDLGSGAGNDCFVARTLVGEEGKVTGIDFTDAMLEKARKNLEKTGFKNIEFMKGDIEAIPLDDSTFNVVISNCVLSLVPDKQKAFREIYRVLKPGGHFCISDIVLTRQLPQKIREAASMYAGCLSGAIDKEEYIKVIKQQGFTDINVVTQKEILVPDKTLLEYITTEELQEFSGQKAGIYSITVVGKKEMNNEK